MKKKTIAMLLSFSMVLSAVGAGITPQKTSAETGQPASGSVIEAGATQEPTQEPTQIPENTPAATVTPTAVTTAPPETTSSPAATTTPAVITTNAALKAGEKFTSGNFVYSVITEEAGDVKASAKVIGLSDTGKTKTSVTIPATVTTQNVSYLVSGIKEKSFKNNKKLTTVKIGKNVTYIGRYAFQGMTSLSSLTMGSGVTEIRKYAFAGCKSLRKVTITAKTKFIGEKAFQNCKKLKAVIVNSKKINTIKSNAFRYVKSGCYMVVPSGKKNTYRSLLLGAKASKIKLYVY